MTDAPSSQTAASQIERDAPLDGGLLLLGAFLIFRLFGAAYDLYGDAAEAAAHGGMNGVEIFTATVNCAMFAITACAVLFYARRDRRFRRAAAILFLATILTSLGFILVDVIELTRRHGGSFGQTFGMYLASDTRIPTTLTIAVVVNGLCAAYVLRSRRLKAAFTR